MEDKQMAVLRFERVRGDGGGLGAEVFREKSNGEVYTAPNIKNELADLNRSVVECKGVGKGGDKLVSAINQRLEEANIYRKVSKNQCRAIVAYISGTHNLMKKLEDENRLDDWVDDSKKWIEDTFGKDNIVCMELHRNEFTPHLHAIITPVTQEERTRKDREGEKTYDVKENKTRLCADHFLRKSKLIKYQTGYANAVAKYGFARGEFGSKAHHQSMNEYYRKLREEKIPHAENELELLENNKTEAEKTIEKAKELDGQISSKETKIKDLDKEFEIKEKEVNDKIKALKQSLPKDLKKLKTAVKGQQTMLNNLIAMCSKYPTEENLKKLQERKEKLEKSIEEYKTTKKELENNNKALDKQLQEKKDNFEKEVNDAQEKANKRIELLRASLPDDLALLMKNVQEQQATYDHLVKKCAEFPTDAELEALQKRADELKSTISSQLKEKFISPRMGLMICSFIHFRPDSNEKEALENYKKQISIIKSTKEQEAIMLGLAEMILMLIQYIINILLKYGMTDISQEKCYNYLKNSCFNELPNFESISAAPVEMYPELIQPAESLAVNIIRDIQKEALIKEAQEWLEKMRICESNRLAYWNMGQEDLERHDKKGDLREFIAIIRQLATSSDRVNTWLDNCTLKTNMRYAL